MGAANSQQCYLYLLHGQLCCCSGSPQLLALVCVPQAAYSWFKTWCNFHFSDRLSWGFLDLNPEVMNEIVFWKASPNFVNVYPLSKSTTLISIQFKRDLGLESNMNSVIQTAHCECCVWRLSQCLPAVGRRALLQREQMHFRVARQREYIMLPF